MTDARASSAVMTRSADHVTHITINRPEKKNALTSAMYQALTEAIAQAESDDDTRAVLISGSNVCFTAGNDLADFLHAPADNDATQSPAMVFLHRLASAEKPIVAAAAGAAVGIGTTLLLHCDLIYAAPDTRFQLPFVQLGLCPEAASSLLLPQSIGYCRAAELLLLGEPLSADRALAAGLINEIVPAAELISRATERAVALGSHPPAAVRLSKALLKQTGATQVRERLDLESRHFAARLADPQTQARLAGFFQGRSR